MATVASPMTTEELLAMPDDGVERWLIAGDLRERPMTIRNRFHSQTMSCTSAELVFWRRNRSDGGQVLSGEVGVRLQRNPDTTFGIDVVYISAGVMTLQTDK